MSDKVINYCPVCNGTGYIPKFKHINDGICYKCMAWPDSTIVEIEEIQKGNLKLDDVLKKFVSEKKDWIKKEKESISKGFHGAGSDDFDIAHFEIHGNRTPSEEAIMEIRIKMRRLNHPKLDDRNFVNDLVNQLRKNKLSEQEFLQQLIKRYKNGKELKDFFLNDYTKEVKKEIERLDVEEKLLKIKREELRKEEKKRNKRQAIGCLAFLIIFIILILVFIFV